MNLIQNNQTTFLVSGRVEIVNVSKKTITLWFHGVPGLFTVPIVDEMPGWFLRDGVTFRAEVSAQALRERDGDNLKWYKINPDELQENEMTEIMQASFEIMIENRPELAVCTQDELREMSILSFDRWKPVFSIQDHLRNQKQKELAGDYEERLYRKYGIDPYKYPLRVKCSPCPRGHKTSECTCDYRED